MFKQQLYIGLNDKDSHKQIITNNEAEQFILEALEASKVDSFTISYCTRFYKNEKENTIVIEVMDEVLRLDRNLINLIKFALNQECIMRVIQKVNEVEFI